MSKRYFEISLLIPENKPVEEVKSLVESYTRFEGGVLVRETTATRPREWVASKVRERLRQSIIRRLSTAAHNRRPRAQVTIQFLKDMLNELGGFDA